MTDLLSVYFTPDHEGILLVIIMVQFTENDRMTHLENQQLRCATSSSERPVQFASHISQAQPLSEVGLIFKLENILTCCFGDNSMKMAMIYNNNNNDNVFFSAPFLLRSTRPIT